MNNKTLLFVITGVLLLGGVFVLSKNQSKVGPASQVQSPSDNKDVIEKEDEAPGKEDAEDKDEDENDNEETTTVSVIDSGFEPNTVTVKTGTEVVWINNTSATANVSSAQHPTHLVYPPLNLGILNRENPFLWFLLNPVRTSITITRIRVSSER